MVRLIIAVLFLIAPVVAGAQPAKEPYAPGLGEFMTATQLRSAKFAAAFDKLTKGCNACHTETKKAFIKIQRPSAPPVSNQAFRP